MWSIPQDQRDEVVQRACASLSAIAFFAGKAVVDVAEQVRMLEQSSYAKAEMAASVTTGNRPHVEGVRMYTHVFSLELRDLLKQGAAGSMGGGKPAVADVSGVFDLSSGTREVLNKERAETVLKPLLAAGASFVKVKLSGQSFGADSSEVAAAALANNAATLKDADLSDVIAGRPEAEALIALKKVLDGLMTTKLDSLDLSDNALGEKGVRAAGDLLKAQPGLKSLTFCNDGISKEAAAAIAEILPAPQNLQKLHFFNNMSGDEGAFAIANVLARSTSMQDFRMSSTRVMEKGGLALAQAIGAGSKLVKIDLKDNTLGEIGGKALAKVLRNHPNLKHVILSETAIGNKGAIALVKALSETAPHLEVLELACNDITTSGASKMAPFLMAMKRLTKVVLAENEINERGTLAIASALTASGAPLQELDFYQCGVRRLGAQTLAKLASEKGLRTLGLNGNMIPAEALEVIVEALGEEVLGELDENDEDDDGDDEEDDDDDELEAMMDDDDDELEAMMGGLKM